MKRKYKVGQTITLPAIKSEGIRKSKAQVVEPPNRSNLMTVRDRSGEYQVAVSPRTGRVLAAITDCAPW